MKKKVTVLAIVVLILGNIYFGYGFLERDQVIENYYHTVVSLSQTHIARAYVDMEIAQWIFAFLDTDIENIPSEQEWNNFLLDMEALTHAFQVYVNVDYTGDELIEKLDYDVLEKMFVDLANTTKSEILYQYHKNSTFNDYMGK